MLTLPVRGVVMGFPYGSGEDRKILASMPVENF